MSQLPTMTISPLESLGYALWLAGWSEEMSRVYPMKDDAIDNVVFIVCEHFWQQLRDRKGVTSRRIEVWLRIKLSIVRVWVDDGEPWGHLKVSRG